MVARAIHMASKRAAGRMVAVNCAAIPENLVEAELFGHAKGAFHRRGQRSVGRFEQAHRGTIFLDEVGEIPLAMQPKLLRVLQEREFQRVGGSGTIQIDTRVIAASNIDLEQAVGGKTISRRSAVPAERGADSRCRRCAIASATFRFWRITSSKKSAAGRASRPRRFRPTRSAA